MSSTVHTSRHRPGSTPATLLAALLLAALVVPAVVTLPDASAQTVISSSRDTSHGWDFPAEADHHGLLFEDPTGDMQLTFGSQVPATDAPAGSGSNVDLIGVQVDEVDATLLRVRFLFNELDVQTLDANEGALSGIQLKAGLDIGGRTYWLSGALRPTCDTYPCTIDQANGFEFPVTLRTPSGEDDNDNRTVGDPPSRVVMDEDFVELLLPRRHLTDVHGSDHVAYDAKVHVLAASAEARICFITFNGGSLTCTGVFDGVDTSGASFALAQRTAGTHVRFADPSVQAASVDTNASDDDDDDEPPRPRTGSSGLQGPILPETRRLDVPVEDAFRLPIGIQNDDGIKRLVKPSVEVRSDHPAVRLDLPESITLPAGQNRPFDLVLNGTQGVTTDDPLRLRISLVTLGQRVPHVDVLDVSIRPLPALAPETPRLYLHSITEPGTTGTPLDALSRYVEPFASTLADDPAGTAESVGFNEICFCRSVSGFPMGGALASDLHMDIEEAARFEGVVEAPVAGALELRVAVVYGETAVAHGFARLEIAQGTNEIAVPMIVTESAAMVPAGASLVIHTAPTWRPGANVPFMELAGATEDTALQLQLKGASFVELPVLSAPEVISGAEHLAIGLQRGYDRMQYVNPGAATLWNVTILNQANATDEVRVSVNGMNEGWRAEVLPGQTYRLPIGSSISVGIRVVAPEDAAEAEVSDVNVTVRSKMADGRASRISFGAVVTGMPIPEPAYRADNETAAQVSAKENKDSPAPAALVPVVLGLLGSGLVRRRRCD